MTTVQKAIHIHSPPDHVYAVAEDSEHWDSWFVGFSDKANLSADECSSTHPPSESISVCVPFPLSQRVTERRVGAEGVRWKAKPEKVAECCKMGPGHTLVVLGARQSWTYTPIASETEVAVTIKYPTPTVARRHRGVREKLDRLAMQCLEQSLENLRRLCEAD